MTTSPRGIRNNNPLNIRVSNNAWIGKLPDHMRTDADFEQFATMVYGLRAGILIIKTYIQKYRADTIGKIISRFAPSTENDVAAYVRFVCSRSGLQPTTRIAFANKYIICGIIDAMVRFENGQEVSMQLIETAYEMVKQGRV